MNEEIKEILLIIKSCKQDYDKQKNGMHTFDYGELYLLYDYITNLQQKYEEADYDRHKLFEENERLKERVAYLERSNNRREDTILGLRQEISDAEDCNDELKKKLDKTLEVLQYELQFQTGGCYHRLSNLFDYLQNGSEDNDKICNI